MNWLEGGELNYCMQLQETRQQVLCVPCRVTRLPPGVLHLHLTACHVEGIQLPRSCALRSLALHSCNPGHAGATFAHQSSRATINLLDWMAASRVQESMQVSDACLTLGPLSMARFARRLAEAPVRSLGIEACTLHRSGGELSMHNVADLGRYLRRVYGRLVSVSLTASKNSCLIEKL
jgi:hypothetical protein